MTINYIALFFIGFQNWTWNIIKSHLHVFCCSIFDRQNETNTLICSFLSILLNDISNLVWKASMTIIPHTKRSRQVKQAKNRLE